MKTRTKNTATWRRSQIDSLEKLEQKAHSNLEEVSDRQLGKTRAKKHSNLAEVSDTQLKKTQGKKTQQPVGGLR